MRKRVIFCLAILAMLAVGASAYADNWTMFYLVGNSVSVSFAPVDNTTYTWKFRNDGYNTITYMEFTYSYIDANTGQYKTDTDAFPGSLAPGQVFGGWSAFTAVSRTQPIITITKINRN